MPIYEYRCPACGADFEKMQKFTDPTPSCPACGAADVKKKVSASAFVLKGAGWYKDHYGLKKSGSEGGKSEGGGAEGPKSEGGKPEGGKSEGGAAVSAPAPAAASGGGTGTSGGASSPSST